MKVLLLGANGQLGMDIRAEVEKHADIELQALLRSDCDVEQYQTIGTRLTTYDFDVLINCTSYHKTDEVEENTDKAFDINAFAVREMAKACQVKSAQFIHISTDYVFGGPNAKQPLVETDVPSPVNVYGASKLMGESLAQNHCDKTSILRVASLFGVAGASGKGGNFVETMIRLAKERGALKVVGDQWMSPTSTADVAWMICQILKANAAPGVYHAVNSGQATWHEFAKTIIEAAGIDATVEAITADEFPTKAARPSYSVLNNAKLARVIGDIPHWQQALEQYLEAKGYCTHECSH
ncbi:MAG: dTDP-4-dehydrorhamnose reductase [Coxiellaceae bacterium]|nr:dTDP-4-dehydrorhamnose reductase [Coxiellaceae bacterium]